MFAVVDTEKKGTEREMKILKRPMLYITIVIFAMLINGPIYNQVSGRNNVHYKDNDYCFVHVEIDNGSQHKDFSGTMSVNDYEKWVDGKNGTVFIYTDNKAKYGERLNVSKIVSISNYGNTPYAYD